MRCLNRNKQTLYYALYQGREQIVDSDGLKTGEYRISYSDPVMVKMNISGSRGSAYVDMFGINVNYTKALVTDDINCPIDEKSILWIDADPEGPHDYVVVTVARTINSVAYAIKKVESSG